MTQDKELDALVIEARDIYQSITKRYVVLGSILGEIREKKPGIGFYKICRQQIGIDPNTAASLIGIAAKVEDCNIDINQLQTVGWSKAAIVCAHANHDNWQALIALAQSVTKVQLEAKLKGEPRPMTSIRLDLAKTTRSRLYVALKKYGLIKSLKGHGYAMDSYDTAINKMLDTLGIP